MFGYAYCAMYRGKNGVSGVKDNIEKKIEETKKEFKEEISNRRKIINITTRKPI